jgi:hypothetical protein
VGALEKVYCFALSGERVRGGQFLCIDVFLRVRLDSSPVGHFESF